MCARCAVRGRGGRWAADRGVQSAVVPAASVQAVNINTGQVGEAGGGMHQ